MHPKLVDKLDCGSFHQVSRFERRFPIVLKI